MSLKLGNTNIAGIQVLYSTTGNNTDGAMTQKATATELNNCVHKTGNETITGNKTFSGLGTFRNYNAFWKTPYNIIVRSESIENGVTPSSNQYMGIEFRDKNDVRVGWIGLATKTDGTQQIELQKQGSTSGFAAPTPSVGDNSNQIATTAWVNNLNNNVVHKTGNETISGTKTFTGDGWITRFQNPNVTYNTAPSSDKPTTIAFTDKNGTQMGVVECFRHTDNSTVTQLNVYGSNGNWSSQPLILRVFSDGYTVAYAPTSHIDSYRNEIVTAAYVNTKFQVVSTLPANPNGNVFYFIPE